MAWIGVLHFTATERFVRIVPRYLPAPEALVLVSGIFEIAGGIGLLLPRTRRLAGLGLILLYVAVFPANLNMAMNEVQADPAHPVPSWALWARLPFQALFMWVAYWTSRPAGEGRGKGPG